MKIHALLAALVLAAPATTFADRRSSSHGGHGSGGGRSVSVANRGFGGYRGGSYRGGSYRGGYAGHSYRSGYRYSPRYYGSGLGYGYGYGYGSGFGYYSEPSVVLSYSSAPQAYRDSDPQDSLEMDVQQALRRRGYYRGAVDGDIGPGSRAAIRAFQNDHGLSVSGRIDGTLLRSLNL